MSVNQDKNSVQMAALHRRIQELELQVQEFQSGRLVVTESGSVVINDLANENTMLKAENDKLASILQIFSFCSISVHVNIIVP